MRDSTRSGRSGQPANSKKLTTPDNRKPAKPYPDFPLTPRLDGRWCKKIRGAVHIFGSKGGTWQEALEQYRNERDDLYAGRKPSARNKDGLRLQDLCNSFLHFKGGLVQEGSLTLRSWYDYQLTCQRLADVLGKERLVEDIAPRDFEALRRNFSESGWGPVKIGNEVNRTRIVFRYGIEQGVIGKPVLFGNFKRTDRKTLRKHRAKQRAEHGARMFTPEELHRILAAANPCMKAMVLLGINGGLNNMDVATLYFQAMNLDADWLDFPRGKTGVPRRIPLWPETVGAIREWLAVRPRPKHDSDEELVFLTRYRLPWYRLGRFAEDKDGNQVVKGIDNPVAKSFRVLLDNLGINGKRNFLALRHGFRTIGAGPRTGKRWTVSWVTSMRQWPPTTSRTDCPTNGCER